MKRALLFLDSGVLNDILFPQGNDEAGRCSNWFEKRRSSGSIFRVPVICYYEVRRLQIINSLSPQHSDEIRRRYLVNIEWLDQVCAEIGLAMIDRKTMKFASRLWATAQLIGLPTASKDSLDADVLIAATAQRFSRGEREVVIVTKNVRHLARYETSFVTARRWDDVSLI